MLLLRTYHGLSEPYFADDPFLLNHTGVAAPGLHCNIGGRIHVLPAQRNGGMHGRVQVPDCAEGGKLEWKQREYDLRPTPWSTQTVIHA